eukprot:scaffold513_cov22-Tisochrysis_lutea.AAC.6
MSAGRRDSSIRLHVVVCLRSDIRLRGDIRLCGIVRLRRTSRRRGGVQLSGIIRLYSSIVSSWRRRSVGGLADPGLMATPTFDDRPHSLDGQSAPSRIKQVAGNVASLARNHSEPICRCRCRPWTNDELLPPFEGEVTNTDGLEVDACSDGHVLRQEVCEWHKA